MGLKAFVDAITKLHFQTIGSVGVCTEFAAQCFRSFRTHAVLPYMAMGKLFGSSRTASPLQTTS
jgi:hypothetical protein